jgi:hypothetical protein
MARIFTINFTYENAPLTAMISVRQTPFFMEYTLSMLPDEVMALLPGNKIISTGPNQLIFANATLDESNQLMKEVLNAVSFHLQTTIV